MLDILTIQHYLGGAGVYPSNHCRRPDMHQVTSRHTQSLTRRSTDVSSQTNVHGLWEEPDKLIRTHKDSSTEARPNFSNSIQNVNLYRGFWFQKMETILAKLMSSTHNKRVFLLMVLRAFNYHYCYFYCYY